jgi:hypothetical protein
MVNYYLIGIEVNVLDSFSVNDKWGEHRKVDDLYMGKF